MSEAACGVAHDGKYLRKIFVKLVFEHFKDVFLDFVDFLPVRLAVFILHILDFSLDVGNLFAFVGNAVFECCADFGDAVAQLVVAQNLQRGVNLVDFSHDWLNLAQVALRLVSKNFFQEIIESHNVF